ncbi:hypothetical protein [Agathobacter rectalis]|uniref:hypothetical protein n=2 Tax=Agathobacter TaxID=1766253 RepID=UPI0027D2353C|nr:hypothetical protein [Agathobacter rectalis]
MAKYLDLTGLKYFITKRIGKTDISKIGDGTCTGAISALNQSLGNLLNKQDWKEIGTFRDVNEHVISNIKSYRELRVNFMLYYSGSSYITREYVFPVSESNNLEFLFLDGNYYDNNNYSSWCIVYNTIKNSIQNRSSWLRNVILGKDTTCQCVYRVYGR